MARRTSAAALHTARVILRHFDIALHPEHSTAIAGMQANQFHLAVLIDYCTQAYEVALVRPELRYWHIRMRDGTATAPQLGQYMRKVLEALEKIPGHLPTEQAVKADLPEESGNVTWKAARPGWARLQLHEFATKAAKAIRWYYVLTPQEAPLIADEEMEFLGLAKLIEVSIGLASALKAIPLLRKAEPKMRQGQMTEEQCRSCLREVGVFFERMPHYEDMRDETLLLV